MFLWTVLTDLSVLSADNVETELVSKSLNLVLDFSSSFVCVCIVSICFFFFFFWLLPLGVTTADHLPSSHPISSILCCHMWGYCSSGRRADNLLIERLVLLQSPVFKFKYAWAIFSLEYECVQMFARTHLGVEKSACMTGCEWVNKVCCIKCSEC